MPDKALTARDVEELLLMDAASLAQCNIDKKNLFRMGWPND